MAIRYKACYKSDKPQNHQQNLLFVVNHGYSTTDLLLARCQQNAHRRSETIGDISWWHFIDAFECLAKPVLSEA